MKQKTAGQKTLSSQETKLIEQLRAHPELLERFQSLLHIACNEDGPLKTADEVEQRLIQEMRRLGSTTMHQWANQAEERVTTELRQADPPVLSRKKNAEVVVRLRVGRGA
jgi:hypothetical protein